MIRVEETKSHEEFLFSTWGLQPPEATRSHQEAMDRVCSAVGRTGQIFPEPCWALESIKKKKELEPSMQVSALPFLGLE